MEFQTDSDLNNKSLFAGFTCLGGPVRNETILDNYTGPKSHNTNGTDFIPDTMVLKNRMYEHDINEVEVTEPFYLVDKDLFDNDAFTGMVRGYTGADQYKVNRPHFPTYHDWKASLQPGEPDDYASFLGFIKKIGHAIGNGVKAVGHAVGEAGKAVGHAAKWTVNEAEHAHNAAAAETGKIFHGAEHAIGSAAKSVGHAAVWTAKEGVHLHNVAGAETKKIVSAVAPYWKYVADGLVVAGAVVAEIATAGAATPFVLPAASAALGALNAIPGGTGPAPEEPFLPGAGGGDAIDSSDPDDGLDGADEWQNNPDDIQDPDYLPDPDGPPPVDMAPKPNYKKWIIIAVLALLVIWWLKRKK